MARRFFLDDFLAALSRRDGSAQEVVFFPPHDAGYPLRQATGISPVDDALLDTTTVSGVGIANMDLDPVVEAYLARLDRK